jgi:hypothetical protein
MVGPCLTVTASGVIVVNFHPELGTIIRETRYLDQLGWKIPETALSVTLQVLALRDALGFQ